MVSLVEGFWSLQGEGPWVGAPTLFLRTAGCPLRCTYCDTVESYEAPKEFEVRDLQGEGLHLMSNPVTADSLLSASWFQPKGLSCWLSLTGGEPLLWPGFCREIFEAARPRGFHTLLETAALDVAALRQVLPATDHVSLDYKLPSTLNSQGDHADAHLACLEAAVHAEIETSLKIVLTPSTGPGELQQALRAIQPFREGFSLVLQPVTPCLEEREALDARQLLRMVEVALDMDFRIRVLPQVHKSLGLA